MEKVPSPSIWIEASFTLGNLIIVMGEGKVTASCVDIKILSKDFTTVRGEKKQQKFQVTIVL